MQASSTAAGAENNGTGKHAVADTLIEPRASPSPMTPPTMMERCATTTPPPPSALSNRQKKKQERAANNRAAIAKRKASQATIGQPKRLCSVDTPPRQKLVSADQLQSLHEALTPLMPRKVSQGGFDNQGKTCGHMPDVRTAGSGPSCGVVGSTMSEKEAKQAPDTQNSLESRSGHMPDVRTAAFGPVCGVVGSTALEETEKETEKKQHDIQGCVSGQMPDARTAALGPSCGVVGSTTQAQCQDTGKSNDEFPGPATDEVVFYSDGSECGRPLLATDSDYEKTSIPHVSGTTTDTEECPLPQCDLPLVGHFAAEQDQVSLATVQDAQSVVPLGSAEPSTVPFSTALQFGHAGTGTVATCAQLQFGHATECGTGSRDQTMPMPMQFVCFSALQQALSSLQRYQVLEMTSAPPSLSSAGFGTAVAMASVGVQTDFDDVVVDNFDGAVQTDSEDDWLENFIQKRLEEQRMADEKMFAEACTLQEYLESECRMARFKESEFEELQAAMQHELHEAEQQALVAKKFGRHEESVLFMLRHHEATLEQESQRKIWRERVRAAQAERETAQKNLDADELRSELKLCQFEHEMCEDTLGELKSENAILEVDLERQGMFEEQTKAMLSEILDGN